MIREPGFPCQRCGVRPDVACRHRPAATTAPKLGTTIDRTDSGRLPYGPRHYTRKSA